MKKYFQSHRAKLYNNFKNGFYKFHTLNMIFFVISFSQSLYKILIASVILIM